jgi:hypothetical protein
LRHQHDEPVLDDDSGETFDRAKGVFDEALRWWPAPTLLATASAATLAGAIALVVLARRGVRSAAARALLALLVAGLAAGTATHVENIVRAGAWPRPDLPTFHNLFWTSLVVLDPFIAGVLLIRPRVGVWLVLGLMIVDLAVNLSSLGLIGPVIAQLGYAVLAVLAIPIVRARVPSEARQT